MKKIYALFMTLCLVFSATAAPLAGVAKKSYPLYQPEVVKAELALDAMQKAPAATQGLQYDAEAGELIRYYNETDQIAIDADYLSQGNLYVDIMAGDYSDYLSLLLFVEDTVEGAIIPEGTYPITSEPAYNTALASQGYDATQGVIPCAYYPLVEQGGTLYINTPMYFMQSGNIVVEHVNGTPKITINAVNSNNIPMTIVFEVGGKSEKVEVKAPLKYDATAADGALDYTYGEDAVVETTDKGFYGMLDVADATSMLALLFVYPEGVADAETTIPAGTYTISDSQAAGTVLASSGVSSTGSVSYSFFAKTNAQGQLVPPLYFPVEGTVEVTKVDGGLKVEVNGLNSNGVAVHVVYEAAPAEPEYALEETVEISNLTTETLTVGEATYLQLTGRNDMLDSDVQLFLNNYTGEDKEYEVNVENYLMTFGGIELTVVEGAIAQATDPEKGKVYTGRVIASAEEEGEVMLVALDLVMYATPAVELVIEDAQAIVDETTGTLLFTATWTDTATMVAYPVMVTVAGFEDVEFKEYEGAQISELQIGDDDNWFDFAVANAVAVFKDGNAVALEGEYTSWATGATYYVAIEGELPAVVEPEKPEPTYTDNNLNPYAFGLESVLSEDKATLTVNYRLNNSKATDVDVIVYNGQDTIVIVSGTTNIGKNTVEISTEGFPTGVDITWAVIVNGTSVAAPTLEEKIYSFYHPSSVDIDNNPENPTFGMLLVNEGMHKVKNVDGYVSTGFGSGIYAFTPSFDLIPNGDQPGYNGGIEFTEGRADNSAKTAYAPRRIRISEDGRIFVTSLNTDGNYLWEVNAADMNKWTPVFNGASTSDQAELLDAEGNFIAAPNAGFDVKGTGENLQLAMYSTTISGIDAFAMGGFRLHEYNLGTATEWTTAPTTTLVEGKYAINYTGTQVEYDNEGGFWIASYRGTASETNPGLVHINAEGVEDCKLVWSNVRQAGIRFNKDFTKLVVAGNNGAAKKATVYTISKDANGAPVLTEEAVVDMAVVGNNLNDFAWDYAGNLYSCGNSSEKLAAWAMPYSGEVVTPAAAKYAFQLEGTGSDYEVYEEEITNLVIDLDNLVLMGGPGSAFQVEVYLPLGEYNMSEDSYQLTSESSIAVLGSDATFIDGYAYEVDAFTPSAKAVVHCEWNGMLLEFHLTMTAEPMEATVVVVENATVEVEKYLLFGDMYDYALKMTGEWVNPEDGLTYPVLVEVPVYYPEATEPSEIMSTVTVGGWGDEDPWLGFGEGTLTVTTETLSGGDKLITATGIVQNPMAGVAIDITISGTIIATSLEDATVTVKPVKMIQNGQLIIEKDGVQYNAQGAILK